MARFISWLLASARSMVGCETSKMGPTSGMIEEYAVYRAVLESFYLGRDIKLVVIEDQTATGLFRNRRPVGRMEYVCEGFGDAINSETVDDYGDKNRRYHRLNPDFVLDIPHVLISKRQVDKIFKQGDGWDRFYKIYPNSRGIITFSRVGLNAQIDQALVYAGNQWHYRAGIGRCVLLTKKEGIWTVDNMVEVWAS